MEEKNLVEFRIIASPSRLKEAEKLQAQLQNATIFNDSNLKGALWNHCRAIAEPSNSKYISILEDDVLLVDNFYEKLLFYISLNPNELFSLYLGSGRPINFQKRIDKIFPSKEEAEIGKFIEIPALIHGLAYVFPAAQKDFIKNISLSKINNKTSASDFNIGEAFLQYSSNFTIKHPVFSLVNHNDSLESVFSANSGRSIIKREARLLWN